mmetsp:Transcript_28035/g.70015  ORF Transcript_28035/g.70015 Transcript_28035/m.70015 type:complete len:269 (+) Transcript_28035:648-1454(+)
MVARRLGQVVHPLHLHGQTQNQGQGLRPASIFPSSAGPQHTRGHQGRDSVRHWSEAGVQRHGQRRHAARERPHPQTTPARQVFVGGQARQPQEDRQRQDDVRHHDLHPQAARHGGRTAPRKGLHHRHSLFCGSPSVPVHGDGHGQRHTGRPRRGRCRAHGRLREPGVGLLDSAADDISSDGDGVRHALHGPLDTRTLQQNDGQGSHGERLLPPPRMPCRHISAQGGDDVDISGWNGGVPQGPGRPRVPQRRRRAPPLRLVPPTSHLRG